MGCSSSKIYITVYGSIPSPAVRACLLTCEALGVTYKIQEVDLRNGEHLTPEFLKINPLHTIPTIQEGDFFLFDSHAIAAYLGEKAGLDSWYPKDLQKRALVHQRLHFNNSVLFNKLGAVLGPVLFRGATAFQPESIVALEHAVNSMAKLLGTNKWLAGDGPTVADCCAAALVSSIMAVVPTFALPDGLAAWLLRCEQTLPNYNAANKKGAEVLGAFVKSKLAH